MSSKLRIVFEMANNHMGRPDHGRALIRAIKDACAGIPFQFSFKLQYRQLDTFIHRSYRGRQDVKYIKRFEETRLADAQFIELLDEMRACGFDTVCTPFDEASVDKIEAHGIDTIKIGSCSFDDWPLLERVARSSKPIIASTAGVPLAVIDNVVAFLLHRNRPLTLMHCVAEYPTPASGLQLNQLDLLRARYPGIPVGFSTHENPDSVEPVMVAVAKGARVFEKHVGLPGEAGPNNDYSAEPGQVRRWLQAAQRALELCGTEGQRYTPSVKELETLHSLKRGIFTRRAVKAGTTLGPDDIEVAFPPVPLQLTAADCSKYVRITAARDLPEGVPVMRPDTTVVNTREVVLGAVAAVKTLLRDSKVVVPGKVDLELSHHYGIERFSEFGLTMFTVVNREYCKKLIVMLPGQAHPEQFHKQKEETFMVLHGQMTVWLDGEARIAAPGDVITVHRGVKHRFQTESGVVFEEISSTHIKDDSYYTDPAVQANKDRKTWLSHWME